MRSTYPQLPSERYADDAIVHCRTEAEAREVRAAIAPRMAECRLERRQGDSVVGWNAQPDPGGLHRPSGRYLHDSHFEWVGGTNFASLMLPHLLSRNPHRAKLFLTRLVVRAAPFALLTVLQGTGEPVVQGEREAQADLVARAGHQPCLNHPVFRRWLADWGLLHDFEFERQDAGHETEGFWQVDKRVDSTSQVRDLRYGCDRSILK